MSKHKNQYQQGDIIFVLYPFSDLSNAKKRPAVIIGNTNENGRYMMAQITSSKEKYSGSLFIDTSMVIGELKVQSQIRTTNIFTAEEKIINRKLCQLQKPILKKVVNKVIQAIDVL